MKKNKTVVASFGLVLLIAAVLCWNYPPMQYKIKRLMAHRNVDIIKLDIEEKRDEGILKKALHEGDKIPDFELPDVKRGMVRSRDLLAKGPLVIIFYRGQWCPYCNLQLHAFQKGLNQIHALGAELVAISPQTPDNSLSMAQKDSLQFYVLSDARGSVGKKFGLMYKMSDDLIRVFKRKGTDIAQFNGNDDWELPLALTYVAAPDGTITYAFLDVDHRRRASVKEVLRALRKIKKTAVSVSGEGP